jgi:hypothetical protein
LLNKVIAESLHRAAAAAFPRLDSNEESTRRAEAMMVEAEVSRV